jgi:hypothetical protein
MNEIQELDIVIDRKGRVSIDVRGVSGPKCEEVTRALEEALAGRILARTRKDEWHQAETAASSRAATRSGF